MRSAMRAVSVGVVVSAVSGGVWAAPTEPGGLTNPMQAAKECVKCHSFANPDEIADEPFVTPAAWQGGMMGNSARDPVFWAGVAIASQDAPGETTTCVRCHVPRAFVGGRQDAISMDDLIEDDKSGVDCELCHRLIDDGAAVGDALYTIDDELGMNGEIRKRGPWDYMEGLVPMHAWLQDPYMGDSRTCGTCHDVTTTQMRVDDQGVELGVLFGEQRTYSEWKNSAYAAEGGADFKSCQDCHMPAVNDVAGCAEFVGQGDTHATGGRRHDLGGANRRMVELLKGVYGSAGEKVLGDAFFDIAIASIDRTLAEAATLVVEPPAAVDLMAGVSGWKVRVSNETGHKLPSGYSEGRVMWLEVIGRYAGEVVYSSGRWFGGALEDDAQLRKYEAVAVEQGSGERFHLLRNDTWLVDSRIPPLGLKQDVQTDPVGDRYVMLGDMTWPNFDEVVYAFPGGAEVVDATPGEDDVMELSVRLLYVINTPEYVEFLADENKTNDAGQDVALLFAAAGVVEPLVVAQWTGVVPLSGLMEPVPGTTSGSSSGGESGGTMSGSTSGATTTGLPTSGGAPGETTSGPVDMEPANDGCSCRARGAGAAWMLLPLFAVRRRRR